MKVEILNPDTVKNLYKNHGEFACVCYDTDPKYAERVGKSCEESGHMSGSRCEYIKFRISGVDRGTAEQCMRHEIGVRIPMEMQDNYGFDIDPETIYNMAPDEVVKNMASFRYIDKGNFNYVTPALINEYEDTKYIYNSTMDYINMARDSTKRALENHGVTEGAANEAVNFMLPRATTTDLVIGFTPEALIHFMHKRLCNRAQEFIRQIARLMRDEVGKYNPGFAKKLVPHCRYLLWCPEGKHSCGMMPTREEVEEKLGEYDERSER